MSNALINYLDSDESNQPSSALTEHENSLLNQLSAQQLLKVIAKLKSGIPFEDILKEFRDLTLEDTNTGFSLEVQHIDPNEVDILQQSDNSYFVHLAKYTPLRLSYEERCFLRLLDSTLQVSEYTDKIDVYHDGNKARRIAHEIKQVCAILSGLSIAHNYEDGQRLVRDRDYDANAEFFRSIFEIGRRYKILNPDRMRHSYGKLIYFLMDSRKPDIQELLNFDCVMKVRTVYDLLERKKNGLALLADPLLKTATMEITGDGKTQAQIRREILTKESAVKHLIDKYSTGQKKAGGFMGLGFLFSRENENLEIENSDQLSRTELETCLYSLSDHNAHLRAFRDPCDDMIKFLKENFDPQESNPKYSLAINAGFQGARLTHGHAKQFTYVLQSLTLWREIAYNMFALWHFAELDLLDSQNPYRLRNTGQGLNRVQDGPNVIRAMRRILANVQQQIGTWIGSNVIHLGDHNVPNSLWFIDKYTQIPRILVPIVSCIKKIPELYQSTSSMKQYIDTQFGGPVNLKMMILNDFFCHAFDGSGADNFNDAGSCIDGRLTSAWNWCSMIEKKKYFPIFLLTNFSGFDGRFDQS
ncbi:UPF0652 protein [Babesia microti strain RI]|uniref:UPF0652 protein n=1 Tax=Babesia microti (strain RI) TaxID=1133968 RepID=A0A1R4ABX3_BABMR|nr:UPF0652 protein [Babesia microti strain RI]SJK86521.1 UPF0652 protein [Babesia microti strain RI]|eukprot:XP_021338671.1 UPF0652 protein [Babesia microti strain RI]